MTVRIINQDILDDDEPPLLIQRYVYPSRTYQVIRKPTSPDEQFEVSEGIEIDPNLYWAVNRILFDDSDEEFPEVFAQIFLDEENPPTYDPEDLPDAEPYAYIEYEAGLFHGRPTYQGYDTVEEVCATTLQEAIDQVLMVLDPLVSAEKAEDQEEQKVPETEEELHDQLWSLVETIASFIRETEEAGALREEAANGLTGADKTHEIDGESLHIVRDIPTSAYSAGKLLDIRSKFTPGTSYIAYPKRHWISLADLERRAWKFVEHWSIYEQHSVTDKDEYFYCSCCHCNVTKRKPHRQDCIITKAQKLLEIRQCFPTKLAACQEKEPRPKPLPRDPSEPITRSRTWKRYSRPNYACTLDLRENLVPYRNDVYLHNSIVLPLSCDRYPSSVVVVLFHEPAGDSSYVTWFADYTVTIPSKLSIGPFPVQTSGSFVYPTEPGVYKTWLWGEQVKDCRDAGCTAIMSSGWGWFAWTSDNQAWQTLCASLEKLDPTPGGLGSTVSPANHIYDLALRAEADPRHPWMLHWFSYTLMQCNRALYHSILQEIKK